MNANTKTKSQKRDDALRAKLLETIANTPGLYANQIPMSQRRFLREMELLGKIEIRDYLWYVVMPEGGAE